MISHVGDVAAQAGDRGEAHRAGAEHGDDCRAVGVLASGDDGSGEQCGVDAAGERFDEHGAFVGHVADAVELGLVRDELGCPAAAGRAAESGLDAGLERSGCEMGVVVAIAGSGAGERRSETTCLVAEDGFEDHPGAVVEFSDHLVAGHERERDHVVEVQRGMPFDERQVGAADPREAGVDPVPPRPGKFGFADVRVGEWAELDCRDR